METRNSRPAPARAVHPGEILREELRERGIRQKDFARAIGMQATHLSEFINGRRDLNEDLAMRLEAQLGIPFKTWMRLHSGYIYERKACARPAAESRPRDTGIAAAPTRRQTGDKYEILPIPYIARHYFGKSAAWLHHRINGNPVRGKVYTLSPEQKEVFNAACRDISQKIGSLHFV